jgi:hypothetical protein
MAKHSKEQQDQAAIRDSKQRLRNHQSFPDGTRAEIESQKARASEKVRLANEESS